MTANNSMLFEDAQREKQSRALLIEDNDVKLLIGTNELLEQWSQ